MSQQTDLRAKKQRARFCRWMEARGAVFEAPLNWEILRARTKRGLLLVHKNAKGRLTLNPVACEALEAFESGDDEYLRDAQSDADPTLLDEVKLHGFIEQQGRVTVADIAAATGADMRKCFRLLYALTHAGKLAVRVDRRGPMIFSISQKGQ